ncbi:hypothetical protein GCM10018782_00760 [Streptomyces griseoaurantiacus]|nr:hypothetical protein GCM10018782_00760 [Streptomyces griseoaurantiacus]
MAYGLGDRGDERVEALGGGAGGVEVSERGAHGGTVTAAARRPDQRTGGTETVMTISIGTSPSLP